MSDAERLQCARDVCLLKIHSLRHALVGETQALKTLESVLEQVRRGELDISRGIGPVIAQKRRESAEHLRRYEELKEEVEREERGGGPEEDTSPVA